MTDVFLDACGPPSDPAACAADVKEAGAVGVGLYAINLSAPECTQTTQYIEGVAAAGVGCRPIITPGESPPPVSGVPAAVAALPPGVVFIDIEQPGVDTPPPQWHADLVAALYNGGYRPITYCTASVRPEYSNGEWWAVNWDVSWDALTIPQGAVAVQGAQGYTGSSGASYDRSKGLPGLFAAQKKEQPSDMAQQVFRQLDSSGQQHAVFLTAPDSNGISSLYHRVWLPGTGWQAPVLIASGLSPAAGIDSPPEAVGTGSGGPEQLHILGRWADTSHGTSAHFWTNLPWTPETTWGKETL